MMKRFLFMVMLYLCSASTFAVSVPFQSYTLSGNASVHVNYSFAGHPIIYCFANTPAIVGVIAWPYNRTSQQSSLPVSLITDSKYQGFFADPSGVIVIANNTNKVIQVGCVYAF